MDVYYTGQFVLPLPQGHRFPMAKYHMLRDRLAAEYQGIDETVQVQMNTYMSPWRTLPSGKAGKIKLDVSPPINNHTCTAHH